MKKIFILAFMLIGISSSYGQEPVTTYTTSYGKVYLVYYDSVKKRDYYFRKKKTKFYIGKKH